MATPKLKPASAPAASPRLLRPSGAAPAAAPKLKSASGKTITPKSTATAPKTAAPANPTTAAPKAPKTAAPAPQVDEAAIQAAAEAEAAAAAAAEAQAAAEAEAARLAQEEYERQMEEYNRQMEEYNRQMAALQAAEEQATAEQATVEASEAAAAAQAMVTEEHPDTPTPTEKLRAAKGNKPKSNISVAGTKKKKKKPAGSTESTMSDEEAARREAYMRALAEENEKQPIWKNKLFLGGAGALVVTIGVCTTLVVQKQAEDARIQAHIDYTNSLLKRAQEINQKAVENLSDASKKGVDVTCTMADAKALMEVVIDPFVKNENGKPRYGARAEGVAQNACLLLGLAAEKDTTIRDMIFDSLGKNCNKIKPVLFKWLLQRIAISDAKGVNESLKKLAEVVTNKQTAKPWMQKSEVLAGIWECIGLRVTPADTPEIVALLKSDITDNKLAGNLCICLDNILTMMDDAAEKAKLGDEIFEGIPEKLRKNNAIATSLARACSPKALEFYKSQLESEKWKGAPAVFIGAWGNDEILDYVLEQKEAHKDNAQAQDRIQSIIGTILAQNRERSIEAADKLLGLYFDEPFGDTSGIQDIINKTDPMSTLYIGEGAELDRLNEELKKLEKMRKQKQQVIRVLGTLHDHDWVIALLDRFVADKDEDIKYEAEQAKEKAAKNAINDAQVRDSFKSRSKD